MTPQPETNSAVERARQILADPQGDVAGARRLLEAEIRADPDRYETLDLEAQALVRCGESELALRLIDEYLRVYPECGEAAARLAWVHWQTEKREEALAEVRAALARDPSNHAARRFLLQWLLETRDWEGARKGAEEALEQTPGNADYLMVLARAAAHLRNEKLARKAYGELIEQGHQPETVARTYGEFLLDMNHTGEAARLLEPWLHRPEVEPSTLLRGADALFRSGHPQRALEVCRRIATDPRADSDEVQHDLLDMMHRNIGLTGTDEFAFEVLRSPGCLDSFGVELLERVGQRGNRGSVIRVFEVAGREPLRFPRTMARFLSTFYSQPVIPGTTSRWVSANRDAIERNATLWGGVGAWHVARGKWAAAAEHLARYEGRPGVKPWMILLLGRALENLGDFNEACRHYRHALTLPPDHSEPGLRSRLAFLLALDDMAAAGKLILMDCSEAGKKLTTAEDLVRMIAVEALSGIPRVALTADREEMLQQALGEMARVAREDPYAEAPAILKRFRDKMREVLSREASAP